MSGEDGSLGEIRRALAGITRRLDALADAVGVVAATAPSGAPLDEPTRARLAGLESLLAIGRGMTPAEAYLLAVDRAVTHTRADCAAILQPTGERTLMVLAQRGFRLPLEPRADEGIVGRAPPRWCRRGPASADPTPCSTATGSAQPWRSPYPTPSACRQGLSW